MRRTQDIIQNLVETLESLANPLGSLRVRLQAAPRSVAERASELGVLLVHYSKPGSAHSDQQDHIPPMEKDFDLILLKHFELLDLVFL